MSSPRGPHTRPAQIHQKVYVAVLHPPKNMGVGLETPPPGSDGPPPGVEAHVCSMIVAAGSCWCSTSECDGRTRSGCGACCRCFESVAVSYRPIIRGYASQGRLACACRAVADATTTRITRCFSYRNVYRRMVIYLCPSSRLSSKGPCRTRISFNSPESCSFCPTRQPRSLCTSTLRLDMLSPTA